MPPSGPPAPPSLGDLPELDLPVPALPELDLPPDVLAFVARGIVLMLIRLVEDEGSIPSDGEDGDPDFIYSDEARAPSLLMERMVTPTSSLG
ncbi:uncharacterized protein LOC109142987 [Larimichthys crocea]|uniref:uncharacterized protein LOC109142987 n=1 Tax=Larimichthys crocea TaxID=215358 RepID=UPI000F5FB62C|nr:uncharacterized protein LOC109142987 [Larimichthys crocea]